jgi:hypothetical protein
MGFAFDNIVMIRTIAMNMITVIGKKALPVTFLALLVSTIALPSSIAWAQETNGDYYTIKYDAQGNVLWSRAYDGGRWDYAYKVAVDGEGNIIVTGASEIWHDYNENGEQDEEEVNYDYYTIKYDSNGNEQWHAIYDGEARDEPFAMAVDSDNNVIVSGRSYNGTDYDYCTIKYNRKGAEVWAEPVFYDGGKDDGANSAAVDSQDNIIITGYSDGETINYCTIKYNSMGDVVAGWPAIYDSGFTDAALEVAIDSSNDSILVTGVAGIWHDSDDDGIEDEGEITTDFCTIKYSPSGDEVWPEPVLYNIGPDSTRDTAFGLAIDTQNNIIVTGSYSTRQEGQIFSNWHLYAIIKYDSDGSVIDGWPVIYDGDNQEHAYDVAVDPRDNSIIVTGKVSDDKTWNYHTIKYDSTGAEQWHQTYDGSQWDSALSVAVDPGGNIIVTGSSQRSQGSPSLQPTIAHSSSKLSYSATQGSANPPSQTLDVWNSGSGTLNWSVSDDATWLSLAPTSGSSTGEHDAVTVSVDISGIPAGDYTTTIAITTLEATNSPQEVPVSLHIGAAPAAGLSGGSIAGIVAGSLVVAGLVIFFSVRRRGAAGKHASVQ